MRSRSATRSLRAAPLASLCVSIGSPMIAPTVIRGSSDPYGSWKMICIRRRIRRSSSLLSPARSIPSNRTAPSVGSRSRIIARPVVLLPQPDSPTRPSVSPLRTSKLIPSTALTVPTCGLEDAGPDREVDLEVLDLDEVRQRLGRGRAGLAAA